MKIAEPNTGSAPPAQSKTKLRAAAVLALTLLALASLVPGRGWAQTTEYDFSAFVHDSSKTYSTESMGYTASDGTFKYWSGWFASDGTTMWVAGYLNATDAAAETGTLIAHTLADGSRDSSKDITLASGNGKAIAAATDGTTMWVLGYNVDNVYAYALSDGTRQDGENGTTDREFDLIARHRDWGHKWNDMWTDGTTMYLLFSNGSTNSYVRAYNLSSGNPDWGKGFRLASYIDQPWGIWSDETTMWVSDIHDAKLYAYTLSSRSRDSAKDLTLTEDNDSPENLYHDGSTLWVNDVFGLKMYAYEPVGGM